MIYYYLNLSVNKLREMIVYRNISYRYITTFSTTTASIESKKWCCRPLFLGVSATYLSSEDVWYGLKKWVWFSCSFTQRKLLLFFVDYKDLTDEYYIRTTTRYQNIAYHPIVNASKQVILAPWITLRTLENTIKWLQVSISKEMMTKEMTI